MQDANDDMDALLRRAADNYPLNTGSADWNQVFSALQASKDREEADLFKEKISYRNLLLLMLLLCAPLLCIDYTLLNSRIITANDSAKMDREFSTSKASLTLKNKSNNRNQLSSVKDNNKNDNHFVNGENKGQYKKENAKFYKTTLANFRSGDTIKSKEFFLHKDKDLDINKYLPLVKNIEGNMTSDKNTNANLKIDSFDTNSAVSKSKNSFISTSDTSLGSKTGAGRNVISATKKNGEWSIGFLTGPDFSTVKFQSVNKTGFSAGLLLGYSLSKKLTVETGVLWDKKFYYTDGEYFKPKNAAIPSFINIEDVNGNCNMLELPVNIAYTIKSYNKSFLSVNAGISSYIMTNENYGYTFLRNGAENEWHLSYKNPSVNLLSVANIGFSYNAFITKSYLLRLQPYLKFPVNKLGMGRLPITSSGVYIVLTKRIL